jgi:hypothetical protein
VQPDGGSFNELANFKKFQYQKIGMFGMAAPPFGILPVHHRP